MIFYKGLSMCILRESIGERDRMADDPDSVANLAAIECQLRADRADDRLERIERRLALREPAWIRPTS